jgi:Ca2+-binding EF-hand superfamily protein
LIDFMVKQIQKCTSNVREVFNLFDTDRSGFIGKTELKKVFDYCSIIISKEEFKKIFDMIDSDRSKKISYQEFCDIMEGKT